MRRVAQNTIAYLRMNREQGKTCLEALIFLRDLRKEVRNDISFSIKNPDPQFAQYCRQGNSNRAHFEALFGMLKTAGYSRVEIGSAVMDDTPVHGVPDETGRFPDQGLIIRNYISLTSEVLAKVFNEGA